VKAKELRNRTAYRATRMVVSGIQIITALIGGLYLAVVAISFGSGHGATGLVGVAILLPGGAAFFGILLFCEAISMIADTADASREQLVVLIEMKENESRQGTIVE